MLTLGRLKAQFVSRAVGTYPLCWLAAFLVRHPEGLAIVRAGPAHSRRPEEMPSCGSAPTPATSTPAIADEYAGLTCVCSSGWRRVSTMRRGWPASVGSPRKRSRVSSSTRRALQVNRAAGPACPECESAPTSWEACHRPTLIRTDLAGWWSACCQPALSRGARRGLTDG